MMITHTYFSGTSCFKRFGVNVLNFTSDILLSSKLCISILPKRFANVLSQVCLMSMRHGWLRVEMTCID